MAVAEITKVLNGKIAELIWVSQRVMAITLKEKLDQPKKLIEKIYGTTKIVEILAEIKNKNFKQALSLLLGNADFRRKLCGEKTRKFLFGLSIYNLNAEEKFFKSLVRQSTRLANTIKKSLSEDGLRNGFVKTEKGEVSSGSIKKNKLLEFGADFVLITGKNETFVGKTIAIQEFEEYEKRNYQRPARNLKSGIMPIKLARIMINLAQAKENEPVLDPFCGDATILQELVLLGFKQIIGFDKNEKAVKAAKENLVWLFGQYPNLEKEKIRLQVLAQDATSISTVLSPASISAIISEPYLGPRLEKPPSPEEIRMIFRELAELYLKFFQQAFLVLKPNGKIVIIFPCFQLNKNLVFLEILEQIKKSGFVLESAFPLEFQPFPAVKITARNSILYEKENQILIREILIFRKAV